MKKTLTFLVVLWFTQFCSGQRTVIDSLEIKIQQTDNAQEKIDLYVQLVNQINYISVTDALTLIDSVLQLADNIQYKKGRADALVERGISLLEMSNYSEALDDMFEAKSYYESQSDSLKISNVYSRIGIIHLRMGDIEEALDISFKADKIAENIDNYYVVSKSANVIGEIYLYSNDTLNAHKYYSKALEAAKMDGGTYSIAMISMNIAQVAPTIEKKLAYLKESIELSVTNGHDRILAYCYGQLGDHFMLHEKDWEQAIENYRVGLKFARLSNDYRMINYNLMYMSECWVELKMVDSAAFYFSQIPKDDQQIEESVLPNILYIQAFIEHQKKEYDSAFQLLDSSFTSYQEYYSSELARQVTDANAKYETERKESEIARQELLISRQTNARNILIGGIVTGLGVLGALFFGFYQRTKRKRLATELALQVEHQRADDLEELSQIKTDFFNNVSHELRTPLTLIMAPLEDASKKVRNVELKDDILLALSNSKRLLNLTNEILDLSKIDASKLELNLSKIDLQPFLLRVFHSFDSLAKSRKINLTGNLSRMTSVVIETDVQKLEKILNNLISNALKYSEDGKKIEMNVAHDLLDKNRLNISILDFGPGISKPEQKKIFDRFYQSSSSSYASGTGIGLALSKELAELLNGSLSVQSEIGYGSRFTLDLPMKRVERTQIEKTIGDISKEAFTSNPILMKGKKPRLLIVEDDLEMSRYLVRLLNKDYQCDTAFNGIQALEKVRNNHYDLISSDVMMPEMDGFEFRKRLIENGHHNTPFILLTARVLEEDKLRGFQLGIDDYITKPFSSSEFKARIYNLISNKISREEIDLNSEEKNIEEVDLVKQAEQFVLHNIDDPSFSVESLAEAMNYSSRQLGRILQKETGLSSVKFILEIRLQKAYTLVKTRKYSTINEIRYEVGIESASYFSSKFKERFGISPGELT